VLAFVGKGADLHHHTLVHLHKPVHFAALSHVTVCAGDFQCRLYFFSLCCLNEDQRALRKVYFSTRLTIAIKSAKVLCHSNRRFLVCLLSRTLQSKAMATNSCSSLSKRFQVDRQLCHSLNTQSRRPYPSSTFRKQKHCSLILRDAHKRKERKKNADSLNITGLDWERMLFCVLHHPMQWIQRHTTSHQMRV
jgi:hypothetical protein